MENFKDQSVRFKLYLYSMLGIVLLLAVSFIILVFELVHYQRAVENRQQSIGLAAELRQSSNDLARLVRTYIITGNTRYKEQFRAVVEIRDGLRARPQNYSLAYWDLKAIEEQNALVYEDVQGETVSLIELMVRAGVTSAELEKLKASKRNSDMLVMVEHRAIQIVEEDSPTDPRKRNRALAMLADDYFISMKAAIMRPIIEAEQLIIARTQRAVDVANQRLMVVTIGLFFLGGLLVFLILKVGQQLKEIIGCSVQELQEVINALGKGNFLTPIKLVSANTESVLGWLARTQQQLAELNLMHFKAIIDSSDDAIISKDIRGVVASWNRSAEKIFGYTAAEMIGKQLAILIPLDRQHEEPEILARVASGEKVEHFETQRLHKSGHLVDVSVTISPIYNDDGLVIGASKIARDISKAKAAEAEIQRLAFFDALTGLANRRLLNDRLTHSYVVALREQSCFALIFLDLDNFKPLNDSRGHEAGDQLLKEAAKRLLGCVRESDTVARFGGDEFVLIVNGPKGAVPENNQWVETIIIKIIDEMARPYNFRDGTHRCTASVGASVYIGQTTSPAELIKQADRAMYFAKASGRNCYKFYQQTSDTL